MLSISRLLIAAALLWAGGVGLAGEKAGQARPAAGGALLPAAGVQAGSARGDRLAAPVVRSQSPDAEVHEAEYCGEGCATRRGWWRETMGNIIDLCCLKHRCFRQMFPYHSCYKPAPPYHLENGGYNGACWRRLPHDGRPCPPVIEGYPALLVPHPPLTSPPADELEEQAAPLPAPVEFEPEAE